ncbi:MAG TPA: protease complex subunit PrcB family protein [Vicinamibacterales bacterium]|jgi:hypothetical protein|nr:protease complex subunit PrcB family protein [Vicinamibacterales bacterium]
MPLRNVIWLAVFLQALPMITVEKGSYTSSDQARQVVVRTADEWTKISRELSLRQTAAVPDFDQNMIVGVCLGSRPTAGYSVEILSVSRESDGLVARYRETRPARDAILAQVITSPCHFVAVPKSSGQVRFEKAE